MEQDVARTSLMARLKGIWCSERYGLRKTVASLIAQDSDAYNSSNAGQFRAALFRDGRARWKLASGRSNMLNGYKYIRAHKRRVSKALRTIRKYDTRTLQMLAEKFSAEPGILTFLQKHGYSRNEVLIREQTVYGDKAQVQSCRDTRLALGMDDLSSASAYQRTAVRAVLKVADHFADIAFQPSMTPELAALIMQHPDRTDTILDAMERTGTTASTVSTEYLRECLNAAQPLSGGAL